MGARTVWAWLLLCGLICACSLPACAAGQKLLLVVLDKVTWNDVLSDGVDAPVLRGLAKEGSAGLMCIRPARGYEGEYVTIGAGSRATSVLDPDTRATVEGQAYEVTETVAGSSAAQAYRLRTGRPVGDHEVVHLAIGQLARANAEAEYPLRLGLLGEELRRAGLRVACVGNADTRTCPHREAAAIAMDEDGLVPLGNVGAGITAHDPSSPAGVRTDPVVLVASFRRMAQAADLVVLDLGEPARVEYSSDVMGEAAAAEARRAALASADRLLGEVLKTLRRDRWGILVIAPTLRRADPGESFAQLAPVIWSPPQGATGLLTSPSTRRPGLVASTDVAPTILQYFGLAPSPYVLGRPMASESTKQPVLRRIEDDVTRYDAVEAVRRRVFRALPVAAAVALWLAALFLLVGERVPRALRILLRGALVTILAAPAAALLVALRPLSVPYMLASVLGLSLAIAFVSGWFTVWRSGHVLPMLLVVGLLAYDLVRGQTMLWWSPLSYSPASGARFYGLGNELGGVLLGAAILGGASVLWPRDRGGRGERILVGLALLGLAVLAGLPRYGANLGISMAFMLGAAIFCLYLWRDSIGSVEVLSAAALGLALLAVAITVEVTLHGTEASHIGRLVGTIQSHGWGSLGDIIARKLAMNWLLVRVSVWTDVAAAALGVLGVVVVARPPRVQAVLRERPWLRPGLIACLLGAAAAFLLNDSGIVAASLALTYATGALAYVSLGDVGLEGHS